MVVLGGGSDSYERRISVHTRKGEHCQRVQGPLPVRQGQNLAVTAFRVPYWRETAAGPPHLTCLGFGGTTPPTRPCLCAHAASTAAGTRPQGRVPQSAGNPSICHKSSNPAGILKSAGNAPPIRRISSNLLEILQSAEIPPIFQESSNLPAHERQSRHCLVGPVPLRQQTLHRETTSGCDTQVVSLPTATGCKSFHRGKAPHSLALSDLTGLIIITFKEGSLVKLNMHFHDETNITRREPDPLLTPRHCSCRATMWNRVPESGARVEGRKREERPWMWGEGEGNPPNISTAVP